MGFRGWLSGGWTRSRLLLLVVVVVAGAGGVAVFALAAPPVVPPSITAHPAGRTTATSARFAFTEPSADPDQDGDRESAGLHCSLDGGAFRVCSSPVRYSHLAAGDHRFRVRASLNADFSAARTFNWVIDRQAPAVVLTFPEPGASLSEASWLGGCGVCGRASDPSGVRAVSVSVTQGSGRSWDGHAFESPREMFLSARGTTGWRLALPAALASGRYTVRVRTTDRLGNTAIRSSSSFSIVAPPAPAITGHPTSTTTASSASFAFTDPQPGVRFACVLDGRPPAQCASPAGYSGLAVGQHSFRVAAVDQAGNVSSPASYSWTITPAQTQGAPFTMSGDAPGALQPGGAAAQIPLTLTNPNPAAIQVTSVTAALDPSSLPAGCQAAWFQLTQSDVSATSPVSVPANGSVTLPAQGASAPSIALTESGTNQDACQQAHLTLTYTGSAHS